jgi:hypothetical protein
VLTAIISQVYSPSDNLKISEQRSFACAPGRDDSLWAKNHLFLIKVSVDCLETGCREKFFCD